MDVHTGGSDVVAVLGTRGGHSACSLGDPRTWAAVAPGSLPPCRDWTRSILGGQDPTDIAFCVDPVWDGVGECSGKHEMTRAPQTAGRAGLHVRPRGVTMLAVGRGGWPGHGALLPYVTLGVRRRQPPARFATPQPCCSLSRPYRGDGAQRGTPASLGQDKSYWRADRHRQSVPLWLRHCLHPDCGRDTLPLPVYCV